MHPNRAFHIEDRQTMRDWVETMGFGMLFAATPDGPRVAHIPAYLNEGDHLHFHLSRGNALTRHMDGATALFVVNGPDGYITPDWYGVADQVPTWNYVAVELEGPVSRLDTAGLYGLLDEVTARHEATLAPKQPWTREKMSEGRFEGMARGVVGFSMEVRAWRGTAKLSQNKPAAVRLAAADGLEQSGRSAIAHMMRGVIE